jgi:antitoxin component of MazEF toxin-antitoxin module
MRVQVQKWSNSLTVRIPAAAEDAQVRKRTVLNLTIEGTVAATPIKKKSKLSVKHLLAKVTRKNLPAEVDFGPSVGRGIW